MTIDAPNTVAGGPACDETVVVPPLPVPVPGLAWSSEDKEPLPPTTRPRPILPESWPVALVAAAAIIVLSAAAILVLLIVSWPHHTQPVPAVDSPSSWAPIPPGLPSVPDVHG